MHILLIHQYFLGENQGGGARFNELARIWEDRGHKITVVAGMVHYNTGLKSAEYKGKYIVRESISPGITILRCHVSEAYNRSFTGRLLGYFSFVVSGLLAGLFRARERYDMVLVTSPPLFVGITGLALSFVKRIPLVFEVRDLWPESAIDTGILKNRLFIRFAYWFERLVYRRSRLINVLTPAFKEKLANDKGVPRKKLVYVPNAADFSLSDRLLEQHTDIQGLRDQLGLPTDKMLVIYVGAHGLANRLSQLIDAAALLSDTPVCFVLIGDGMEKTALMERVHTSGLANVMFFDPVPKSEVLKYIIASDVGTSVLMKSDTFKTIYSNKTFDYMACKKPVLLAIDGVSRVLIESAGCGLYAEPENPEDYARKVRFYLDNADMIAKQGMNGYRYAKKHFDREKLADEYLNALDSIFSD